ncbi:MAG: XdhC family protein, partial [Caldilineaceae bacterium]|nr:XdhC family protein [Caldilineaceae bacterium]
RAQELMREQRSERFSLSAEGQEYDLFVDVQAPPPKLIVVGAVHIAIHLVAFAKQLGFHTMVVDARSAFATDDRFPHVDELITQWPADALSELGIDESTCVVVLTHDEKLDNPALAVAVKSPAQYIGALGSKKTHARRVEALKAEGVTDEQISRIHAPIGIDLGGRKPEEIAVSIIAEIVAVRNGQG